MGEELRDGRKRGEGRGEVAIDARGIGDRWELYVL